MRASHARILLPTESASVSFRFVLAEFDLGERFDTLTGSFANRVNESLTTFQMIAILRGVVFYRL